MATKTLGLGALAALVVGGGFYLLRNDEAEQPAPRVEPAPVETAEPKAPPTIVKRSAEVAHLPNADEVPAADRFLLPDGTWARALNNVKNAPKLDWPPWIPYSPIVERVVDARGQEWYRHADGSMSTTQMTWRTDLGRPDAVTNLANPTDPLPVAPGNTGTPGNSKPDPSGTGGKSDGGP